MWSRRALDTHSLYVPSAAQTVIVRYVTRVVTVGGAHVASTGAAGGPKESAARYAAMVSAPSATSVVFASPSPSSSVSASGVLSTIRRCARYCAREEHIQ